MAFVRACHMWYLSVKLSFMLNLGNRHLLVVAGLYLFKLTSKARPPQHTSLLRDSLMYVPSA